MTEPLIKEIVYNAARDTALASAGSKWTVGGLMTSVLGWVTSSGAAVLIGILVTIGGFLVTWYYQRKREKRQEAQSIREAIAFEKEELRKEELHNLRVAAIKESQGANLLR